MLFKKYDKTKCIHYSQHAQHICNTKCSKIRDELNFFFFEKLTMFIHVIIKQTIHPKNRKHEG